LENDAISSSELSRASLLATANRCFGEEFIFVPIDGTSLSLRDRCDAKDLGIINTTVGARGLQVMSAIAVGRDGTPLGLCGQQFWARRDRVGLKRHDYDNRDVDKKETQRWLDAMAAVREAFAIEAPETRTWFQLDRGGDAWPVLLDAIEHGDLLTVRAAQNRRLVDGYLWNRLRRTEPQASYVLQVPTGVDRTARTACMQIQYAPVSIAARDRRSAQHRRLDLYAVRVIEVGTTPRAEAPIEWLLLTTAPVRNVTDALAVVDGYASRWRIEEFHKTWKTGACRIEDSQLEARDHIVRFAVISAAVAMRIQRLTQLARTTPDEPATVEFSRAEIDATILLREPKDVKRGDTPTVGEVVRWLADLGGFMGPSPKNKTATRKPGAIVIARGLEQIEPVATLLARGVKM
jgi:hypothetical protein